MTIRLNRRRLALVGAAAVLSPTVFVRNGWAQGKEIAIGVWGGAQGDFIKKQVLPKFENDLGCKVLAEEGFTLANVSKLRATKANPKFTVMFVDDLAIPICKAEDLIAPLPKDKIPNLARLYPRFLYDDGYGTGLGVSLGGMFHNTAVKPPQSFAELWDPKYKGKIKLNSPKNTPSVFFLIAAAAVVTGKPFKDAQYEIDKAWDKIAQIKPNVQNVFESGIQAALEVAQGQADFGGIEYSKYIYPYTAKQAPIDMAFMKEGSFAGTNCQVLVKNGPNIDLGAAFMDRMLDPVVQKALAEFALIAPPVSGIEFSAETLKWIPYPERKMDELGLFTPDWGHINARRGAWTERMNQIFSI
jgi:putative spermidine/putrescine transport system substrate-binding protein